MKIMIVQLLQQQQQQQLMLLLDMQETRAHLRPYHTLIIEPFAKTVNSIWVNTYKMVLKTMGLVKSR